MTEDKVQEENAQAPKDDENKADSAYPGEASPPEQAQSKDDNQESLGEHNPDSARMYFTRALLLIFRGKKLCRRGWNGKNMFIFLVKGSTFNVNRPPLLGIYPEGTEINYRPHIDMRAADGSIGVWMAAQNDILADDWEEVE